MEGKKIQVWKLKNFKRWKGTNFKHMAKKKI